MLGLAAAPASAQLRVTEATPQGALAKSDDGNEIRVAFSEPMVSLGRIPEPVAAPFFRITPQVAGRFRWAGTDAIIFTPRSPLPNATRFEVTIDGAVAASGSRLARPYAFSFTTPTLKLEKAYWYRQSGKSDSPLVIALSFNQPVKPDRVLPHIQLAMASHAWDAPELPRATLALLRQRDPRAIQDFEAKLIRMREVAASRQSVPVDLATEWNKDRFPGADEARIVLKTRTSPSPNAWIAVRLDGRAPSLGGPETPGAAQEVVLKLEPAFFATGLRCASQCDPDSHNPLRFPLHVSVKAARAKFGVIDITAPARQRALTPAKPETSEAESDFSPDYGDGYDYDRSMGIAMEDVGFSLEPAHVYAVAVDRSVTSSDGQTLGYTWMGPLQNWHRRAYTSFGSGHGVWEKSGGSLLPYYARNLKSVTEWVRPLEIDELFPAVQVLQEKSFEGSPRGAGASRTLSPVADQIQSYGLDLKPALGGSPTGLLWAALRDGAPIPNAPATDSKELKPRSSIVQVTNLGLTVKDSPQGLLALVTRLDDGAPVVGARVEVRSLDNRVAWSGTSDATGIALAPGLDLRNHDQYWKLAYMVSAEKDGDVAYLLSDWNDGVEPWFWNLRYDLEEAKPLLRGSVFTDRGVYRLGEEVRIKAVLRNDTVRGMQLLSGRSLEVVIRDSQGQDLDKRTLTLSEWSSVDFAFRVPVEAALGRYAIEVKQGEGRSVSGDFLVAAYRRPDFRVDTNLAAETSVAGATLKGVVTGRYLFGAPMPKRPVRWALARQRVFTVPKEIRERFPEDAYVFLDQAESDVPRRTEAEEVERKDAELDAAGQLSLDLKTDAGLGLPYLYTLEGNVTDVSRQAIAGHGSFRVDPAPFYLGLKTPPYFVDTRSGLETDVVAVDLQGRSQAGLTVKVQLVQIQWNSVRRAQGLGFFTWETEKKEVPAGEWSVTSTATAAPLKIPIERGGFYALRATASDARGHTTTTATSFYALGAGYTAWARSDHNRIELVPEKKTYRPGETARIMIKSPWETATALLTTELEGIRSQRSFPLTATQQTVSVELQERDIPNLYVSVVLVKGRSGAFTKDDTSDPGKPAYRVGYVELKVEDRAKRLDVTLTSDREEYRPSAKARVDVSVRDAAGRGGPSEVTLWAVDYGVLSLTAFKTPDVLTSVWVEKALQVLTQDSRQNVISRRVLASKGASEGGGGGAEAGAGTLRKDFRPLAFWLGSVTTDTQGKAAREVTLPDSLTTYRIMAVAGDKESRFGWGEREIRTSKPVLLTSAFPRFLTIGDDASFGSVVHSQLKEKGTAIVTFETLDPALLEVVGDPRRTLEIAAQGSLEARFRVRAQASGDARVRMRVSLLNESDAFEEVLPVKLVATPVVVAAFGQARGSVALARETLELPASVLPQVGGLSVETASTALVGLGEGARYLIDYPYGCAEQRASAALALGLAADLGDAFRVEALRSDRIKQAVATAVTELEGFQCDGGGFAYWKGGCPASSPYMTSYALHVLQRLRALGYDVKASVLEQGYAHLESALGQRSAASANAVPFDVAWQSFAVKVLVEAGRNQDSALTRLYASADRMPVFGLAYLLDALRAKGETGARTEEILRRLRNAVRTEAGSAHVEELNDPALVWLWNSNLRSTGIVLRSLIGAASSEDASLAGLVRYLLQSRVKGRWGNTQENAIVLLALVDYYKKFESEPPDFSAVVSLGKEVLLQAAFQGRTTEVRSRDLAMSDLLARGGANQRLELGFKREGSGALYYGARLRYAPSALDLAAQDSGITVTRRYAPADGGAAVTRFKAGDLVKVTLRLELTQERRFVAVRDPLPAGFEPVETAFATTSAELAREQREGESVETDLFAFWRRGGFDHIERHDDRVQLFASRLAVGAHEFSYLARATTSGTFRAAPARAEEMYASEVFGRTASVTVEIRP